MNWRGKQESRLRFPAPPDGPRFSQGLQRSKQSKRSYFSVWRARSLIAGAYLALLSVGTAIAAMPDGVFQTANTTVMLDDQSLGDGGIGLSGLNSTIVRDGGVYRTGSLNAFQNLCRLSDVSLGLLGHDP